MSSASTSWNGQERRKLAVRRRGEAERRAESAMKHVVVGVSCLVFGLGVGGVLVYEGTKTVYEAKLTEQKVRHVREQMELIQTSQKHLDELDRKFKLLTRGK